MQRYSEPFCITPKTMRIVTLADIVALVHMSLPIFDRCDVNGVFLMTEGVFVSSIYGIVSNSRCLLSALVHSLYAFILTISHACSVTLSLLTTTLAHLPLLLPNCSPDPSCSPYDRLSGYTCPLSIRWPA